MFDVFRANWIFGKARRSAALGRRSDALSCALDAWRLLCAKRADWKGMMILPRISLVIPLSRLIDELGDECARNAEVRNVLEEARRAVLHAMTELPEIAALKEAQEHIVWTTRRLEELESSDVQGND